MNSTQWTFAAGSLGLAALATVFSLKADIGPLVVQCYPGTEDCAIVFEAQPEQCPALLRNGGTNTGPIVEPNAEIKPGSTGYREGDADEALGVALVNLMQTDAILAFISERRLDANGADLPCLVNVFLTREQANALRYALDAEGGREAVGDIPDAILFSEQPLKGGVVLAGQGDIEQRSETFELHLTKDTEAPR